MRKTRNSFFTEGLMPQNIYPQNGAYYPNQLPISSEFDNRLARIERQINRLEHRVSKLESNNSTYIDNDLDTSSNMYML